MEPTEFVPFSVSTSVDPTHNFQDLRAIQEDARRSIQEAFNLEHDLLLVDYERSHLDSHVLRRERERIMAVIESYLESLKHSKMIASFKFDPPRTVVSYTINKHGHVLLIDDLGNNHEPLFKSGPQLPRRRLRKRARWQIGSHLVSTSICPIQPIDTITLTVTACDLGHTFGQAVEDDHDEQ